MSKAFDKIAAGMQDAIAFANGAADRDAYVVHVPEKVDVRAIRKAMDLTQAQFAGRFGFSAAAVRDWEQERRQPEATARVLLTVIAKEPDAVLRALQPA
jgi:putative transcriptional regulator